MVFQSAALFDSLSVYENVAYPLREHRRLAGAADRRARGELPRGGGPAGQPRRCCPRSSRAACASAWAWRARSRSSRARSSTTSRPPGLDPANQNRIGELIVSLQRRLRITSVVVTHELELCFAISNRVALLKDGRIAAAGTADEMRRSEHPDVVAFLSGTHDAFQRAIGRRADRTGGLSMDRDRRLSLTVGAFALVVARRARLRDRVALDAQRRLGASLPPGRATSTTCRA